MSNRDPIIPSALCQMLDGISQPKVERLIEICQTHWENPAVIIKNLSTLYLRIDNSNEAIRFRKFLQNHEIRFLGGGNTKNFLVTNLDTRDSQVFGVKKDMGLMSNLLTTEMRQGLENDGVISSTRAQKKSQRHVGYSLSVTDYFPGGSFEKCYEGRKLKDSERYQQCSENIQKMIIGFQNLQKHGVLFPDAKVTNWMIGNNGSLIIADTKKSCNHRAN